MDRPPPEHDPKTSWESDFASESGEPESESGDIAFETSDFESEPVPFEDVQRPVEPVPLEEQWLQAQAEESSLRAEAIALEQEPPVFEPVPFEPGDLRPESPGLNEEILLLQPASEPPQPPVVVRADAIGVRDHSAPRFGRGAAALALAALVLLAAAVGWVLQLDLNGPASRASLPAGEPASESLPAPPVEAPPPVTAPGADPPAPTRDVATGKPIDPQPKPIEQPATRRVEPPPLKGTTVPPPARPTRAAERAPSPALPPLAPATPPPSRPATAQPTAPPPARATPVESARPPARGAIAESTPPPARSDPAESTPAPTRGTTAEPTPPPVDSPAPPDPTPGPLPRVAVDQPALTPPASPPAQPVTAPAPSAAAKTAPSAGASSAAAAGAPAAVDIESSAIRDVLGRYRSAFNALDAKAAQQVWPTVNPRTLDRAFGQLQEQNVSFEKCTIEVKALIAAASCNGTTRFVPKVGSRSAQAGPRQWNFVLRKASSGGWQIQEVQAR